MDTITSGSVSLEGGAIEKKKEKEMAKLRAKSFGFVFQQIHLVSNLTMFENILASGYLRKERSASEIRQKAMELLEAVNMKEAAMRLPSQVSGGEAQRAAIARALINEPKLIFADEPTGALNRKNSNDVLDLFTKFHNDGQSIVMVTHDIRTALRATRLLYLSDGQIKGDMTLPPYDAKTVKERELQIQSWLMSMEW
jgi:ABC-type antimicrobial peptide transport system, ATPase component